MYENLMYVDQQFHGHGSSQQPAQTAAFGRAEMKNEAQAPCSTVRSLLEIAHQQATDLEQDIGRLGEQLLPVRELSPCKDSDGAGISLGTPEVLGMLRALIDRMAKQQSIVRAISSEIRI
jgi:hypothetical protein